MKSLRRESINQLSLLIILLISWIIYDSATLSVRAQVEQVEQFEQMKEQVKGGKSSSSFRESLLRLKQKQRQPLVSVKENVHEVHKKEEEQVHEEETATEEEELGFGALTSVPKTSFSCRSVPHLPGMYTDEEAHCRVYHLCFDGGRRESFLCGTGTLFNQANLICDHSHQVDCSKSGQFLHANAHFGKAAAASTGRGLSLSWSSGPSLSGAIKGGAQQVAAISVMGPAAESITLERPPAGRHTRRQKVFGSLSDATPSSSAHKQHQQQHRPQQQMMEALGWDASEGRAKVGAKLEVAAAPKSSGKKQKGWWMNAAKSALNGQTNEAGDGPKATTFTDEWRPYFKSKGRPPPPPTQSQANGAGELKLTGAQVSTTQSGGIRPSSVSPSTTTMAAATTTTTTASTTTERTTAASPSTSLTNSSVEYADQATSTATPSSTSVSTAAEDEPEGTVEAEAEAEADPAGAKRRRARQVSPDQVDGSEAN